MTRRNKLIILVSYLLILSVFMLGYRTNRYAKVKKLRADLAKLTSEQNKTGNIQAEAARLSRMIPAEANGPAFIEALYRCADESGLKQHEVATEGAKRQETARPGAAATTSVAKHIIRVSTAGNYRSFAEYLRRVQNIERFNRIVDFKLIPDGDQIKGTITIELYYLPVNNAK